MLMKVRPRLVLENVSLKRRARKETQVWESENAFDFSFHKKLFLTGIAACCASSTECSDHVLKKTTFFFSNYCRLLRMVC